MSIQISPNTVTHARTLANIYKYFPLIILSVCGFTFNTSEFIPIGLLSDIAIDFSISEPQAGMLITVYAWVVMIASLPLMMIASKFALKKLLLTVVGLFVLINCIYNLCNFNDLKNRCGLRSCYLLVYSFTFSSKDST